MKELLPAIALVVLLLFGAVLAFFEGIYLRDQAREFPFAAVRRWALAVRAISIVSLVGAILTAVAVLTKFHYSIT